MMAPTNWCADQSRQRKWRSEKRGSCASGSHHISRFNGVSCRQHLLKIRANIDVQDHMMQITHGQLHLHEMETSGIVCQHCTPDTKTWASDKSGTSKRAKGDREGKRVAQTNKRREDTLAPNGGTGNDWSARNLLLLIRKPAWQRDRVGQIHNWNHRMGRGGGICLVALQTWRISDS